MRGKACFTPMDHSLRKVSCVTDWGLKALAGLNVMLCAYLVWQHGWEPKYVLPAFIGACSLLVLRLSISARVSITLLMLSTVGALLAANFVLGVRQTMDRQFPRSHWKDVRSGARHIPVLATAAQQLGRPFDLRSRLDVLQDLREKGMDAWPSVSAPLLFAGSPAVYDTPIIVDKTGPLVPLGGISRATTVYCNESGTYIVFQNDEHGFSNPPGLWSTPGLQVAVVGDSFAHGACVDPSESFPGHLRRHFPGTLNLGNDAIGPLAELALVKEYLPALRPQVVVWAYFEQNDFQDLAKERGSLLNNYLQANFTQHLISDQPRIDQALKAYVETVLDAGAWFPTAKSAAVASRHLLTAPQELERLLKFSYLWDFLSRWSSATTAQARATRQWRPRAAAGEEDRRAFRASLEEALRTVQSWGGQLVFVYLPEYDRYAIPSFVDPNRDFVLRTVGDLKIALVDMVEYFPKIEDTLSLFPFRQPAHYTPDGYRLVAERILNHIRPLLSAPQASN